MENVDEELPELFNSACNFVKTVSGTLGSDRLLYLYARYKQANDGSCNTKRPGFFDFQGKQKWDAWKSVEGKTKKDAMWEYIDELMSIDPEWQTKMESGEVKAKAGMGVAVSTMRRPDDDHVTDERKTVFDWCKDGVVGQVVDRLQQEHDVDATDENGMTLLHWACDRGDTNMVEALLKQKADLKITDADGQTALHYAAACEHVGVVKLLLDHGLDASMRDHAGQTAGQLTDNVEVAGLLAAT